MDLAGGSPPQEIDGVSFARRLGHRSRSTKAGSRTWVFCHFDPRPGWDKDQFRLHRFARDRRFKLYDDGRLFDVAADPLEQHPLSGGPDATAQRARDQLTAVLGRMSIPRETSHAELAPYEHHALTNAGDAQTGVAVFRDGRTRCSVCHRVEGAGGVGPNLSAIGAQLSRPRLIEALLEPSHHIVDGYGAKIFALDDGTMVTGIPRERSSGELRLDLASGESSRISLAQIRSAADDAISIMPAGLASEISPVEFADLIAYLETLRHPGNECTKLRHAPTPTSTPRSPPIAGVLHPQRHASNSTRRVGLAAPSSEHRPGHARGDGAASR